MHSSCRSMLRRCVSTPDGRGVHLLYSYNNLRTAASGACFGTQAAQHLRWQGEPQGNSSSSTWALLSAGAAAGLVATTVQASSQVGPARAEKAEVVPPGPKATSAGSEVMVEKPPESLLRSTEKGNSMRSRFEKLIRESQDSICSAIEDVDGTQFREDAWIRPNGGGGITRVLQGGKVWEKAGVNVSVVYGSMPAESYRARGDTPVPEDNKRVPFFAAGISCVMHPWNPMAPTMHFNYRYFETDEWNGVPSQWWFGGGTDITPAYLFEEDMKHFHGVLKGVCDKHDPSYYPKFKKWADDYFVIKHRGETRGLGGIFFDDLKEKSKDALLEFSKDCQESVVPAYLPLVVKHKDDTYTEEQKEWQQLRRGRYVEFNLVYDRGTTFGLKTGVGRVESMLMSLPLTCRYEYDSSAAPGSPEADIQDAFRKPRDWV